MFDIERFVEDCKEATATDPTHRNVAEIVARALRDPAALVSALGEPTEGALIPLYQSSDLTIINVVFQPSMMIPPHNHEMWAVIGVYSGREDNIFWRRIKDSADGLIEAAGAKALGTGDHAILGKDIIHSVANPIPKLTGAIHVYGGDFFEAERSEWDSENLNERPIDIDLVRARFNSQ